MNVPSIGLSGVFRMNVSTNIRLYCLYQRSAIKVLCLLLDVGTRMRLLELFFVVLSISYCKNIKQRQTHNNNRERKQN